MQTAAGRGCTIRLIMLPWRERHGRTKKLYRPRTHMGPGSASQHGECNPPAPRKVAGPFDRPTTPARYVVDQFKDSKYMGILHQTNLWGLCSFRLNSLSRQWCEHFCS